MIVCLPVNVSPIITNIRGVIQELESGTGKPLNDIDVNACLFVRDLLKAMGYTEQHINIILDGNGNGIPNPDPDELVLELRRDLYSLC